MSDKQLNKEAYKQATEQIEQEKINLIKGYITNILKAIEENKEKKAKIEERLRVLKKDLEDLQNGNFDQIEERIEKSPTAKDLSVTTFNGRSHPFSTLPIGLELTSVSWPSVTAGTYRTNTTVYYL